MGNDQVIRLMAGLGMEGFGIFIGLLLELRQRDDYRCATYSLPTIARRMDVAEEMLLRVVHGFGLFCVETDGLAFSSPYLDEMMESLEAKRRINQENGRKGGRPQRPPKKVEKPIENPTVKPNQNPEEKSREEKSIATAELKEEEKKAAAAVPLKSWERYLDDAFDNRTWVEIQAMQSGCGLSFIHHLADVKELFRIHIIAQGAVEKLFSSADACSYFSNFNRPGTPTHLRIVELLKRIRAPESRNDPYRYELRDPVSGQRSYCGRPIPDDAPPRPSENAVWSDPLREWG